MGDFFAPRLPQGSSSIAAHEVGFPVGSGLTSPLSDDTFLAIPRPALELSRVSVS